MICSEIGQFQVGLVLQISLSIVFWYTAENLCSSVLICGLIKFTNTNSNGLGGTEGSSDGSGGTKGNDT